MNLFASTMAGDQRRFSKPARLVAAGTTMALLSLLGLTTTAVGANAAPTPVGAGFTVTTADLAYILKQIKIAEAHVANTTSATGPCGALVGRGPNQVPNALTSYGLRTVDGSCNNLIPGRESYGAADKVFPRLTQAEFHGAEPSVFGPPAPSSYTQASGSVFDSRPRTISNLIVDQTSTNPAALAAAGAPVRTQGNPGQFPCTTDPDPLATPPVEGVPKNCVPKGDTLFIPNVTTDVGLSPPYNSLFTLFGQFFDHGVDQTVKGGGTVFVPLKADDPLRTVGPDAKPNTGDEVPAHQAFMVMTRGQNQPGADGVLGTGDDVRDALNTDSPYVDQSQTYSSHSSHQVFLREYINNADGKPASTGKLLGGPPGPTAGGMATWATVKSQAEILLGLKLEDKDVTNVPSILADPYGKFIPGPARGLPQYVTQTGLVEGDTANPIPVPGNVRSFDTPFLTDIAHNADPSPRDHDNNPATPAVVPVPDNNDVASADFAQQAAGSYDDEMLDEHFAAGDGRVNENIGLTAVHQVFHSEHDRLVTEFKTTLGNDTSTAGRAALAEWKLAAGAEGWNGERLFQAARFVTEMEYQHIVFEDFGRKVQPAIQPFTVYHTDLDPAVTAEFAHAVYRFGHSMLTETISRTNPDGSDNSIGLLEGFLNPPEYINGGNGLKLTSAEAAGSIFMGMSDQIGNELDEFVTGTLRNNLLGLPLDLAAINLARARSEGVPPLNGLRRQIHNATGDAQLAPYTSWADFGQNLKHPESLINFVAAYGTHPSITGASTLAGQRAAAKAIVDPGFGIAPSAEAVDFMNSAGAYGTAETGLNKVDLWVGGLAEKTNLFGGLLGSTFNYVFEKQMTDLQNGDRFYYLLRTPGMNLRAQLEGNSFAELMMRNTNAHSLKADAFATADCKFQMSNLAGTTDGWAASGPVVADDGASECREDLLLLRKPDGTIQYREKNTVDPSGINGQAVYNGTAGVDRMTGGNDNDTFLGNEGNDVIEGQGGDDIALGGEGNDRITDLAGADVHKGGPGNDYINTGIGDDIVMGGDGQDFTNGGGNDNETFAGEGNDFVQSGDGADVTFGDGGDDWIQGGSGQDLLIGDHGAPFFDDPAQTKPGNDVLVGQVGENDYDAEGGDDIMSSNSAVDRYAGAAGFDWATHQYDTVPADDDMNINRNMIGLPLPVVVNRDRWQEVEASSGSRFDDVIRGDDVVPRTVGGAGFTGCNVLDQAGIDRIAGLGAILPSPSTPLGPVADLSPMGACPLSGPVWGEGNILLGGLGSDKIEGRGGNDIIDGDRYLKVRISVRAPGTQNEIGSTDLMERPYRADRTETLAADVASGQVDPGDLVIVREIVTPTAAETAGNKDAAVFSDVAANYTVTTTGGTLGAPGAVTTIVHNGGGIDGTDTLRNVEVLLFADTVAPNAPVIGTATAGNARATVNWTAPTVGTASSFTVKVLEVTTNPAGVEVGAPRTAAADATSLVVTGLSNGSTYQFQVSATNELGASPFSGASNTVTPSLIAEATVPGATTIGTATAGNGSATLTWTAPASDGGAPITGYRVRAFSGTVLAKTQTVSGDVGTVIVTGLSNGTAYSFDVAAANAAGTGAPSAVSNTVTPTGDTAAPTVTTRAPAAAATAVAVGSNVTATFSEAVTGTSATTFTLRTAPATGTGTAVAGAVSYNATTR
ncbi:MAG: heme peroxidase, partial [Arthrobacter sp.]|nr:heme peroxidase [Arthrobacter sp.]